MGNRHPAPGHEKAGDYLGTVGPVVLRVPELGQILRARDFKLGGSGSVKDQIQIRQRGDFYGATSQG